jgi:hypothetical protein
MVGLCPYHAIYSSAAHPLGIDNAPLPGLEFPFRVTPPKEFPDDRG